MEVVTLGTSKQSSGTKGKKNLVRINKESDFPLAIKLLRGGQITPFPECDFTMEAHIEGSSDIYKAWRKGSVCKHCKQDGDRLIVFFDNHNFVEGRLLIELTIEYPDPDYSEDGIRQEHFAEVAPIQIVADNGDTLDLRLPEPRVVEKVIEKEANLPAEIKELSEAVPKIMELNPDVGANGLLNEGSYLFKALVARELLKYPEDILYSGEFIQRVNKFMNISGQLADEMPFMEQMSRIALLKDYAQSKSVGFPLPLGIFMGVFLNQLNLTLRGPIDIQGMFLTSHIRQLRIYLTGDFDIAKGIDVIVNSNSSHEEWVEYRNSDDSSPMTLWELEGYIESLHLKFDANKQEQAITLIRNLGFGVVKHIYLEATRPIDGETFSRWLVEALKPYTEKMKAIRDINGVPLKPTIESIGDNFGSSGLSFDDSIEAYDEKGYYIRR